MVIRMVPKQREVYAGLKEGQQNRCAEQISSQSKADNAVLVMIILNPSTF